MNVVLQIIVYWLIQIVLLPTTLIAVIILNYKALIISNKYGVDYTAEKVLQLRCKMHLLGVRKDEDSFALYKALPIASVFSLQLLIAPIKLSYIITGYRPASMIVPDKDKVSIIQYIYARTFEFDRILQKYINDVEQVVVMGAGYDLRALNYAKEKRIKVFELDQEHIQQLKQKCLINAGIQQDWISYVPVDFKTESWPEILMANGFDVSKRTFFLWEGVASYLDENIVIKTLLTIASLSLNESIISFDYNSTKYNQGKGTLLEKIIVRLMSFTGKVFRFGIDTTDANTHAEQFLEKCNLKLLELTLIGKNTKSAPPFSGLIVATKK